MILVIKKKHSFSYFIPANDIKSVSLCPTDVAMTSLRRCLPSWVVKGYNDILTIFFSWCQDYLDDKLVVTLTDFARAVYVLEY